MQATHWRRGVDVLWRRSLDAVVVLPPGTTEPLTLTQTGPELWDLLAEVRSLDELAVALAAGHDAEEAVVVADIAPIIDQLVALSVVEQIS